MKKVTKIITSIAVAGKLATSPHIASAGGLGKAGSSNPSLSMDQIGFPLTILTPPINADEILNESDRGGKVKTRETGTIFAVDSSRSTENKRPPRIDFVVNNIPKSENPVVVFLAYSTVKGDPSQWADLQLADFSLDRDTFKVVSAVQIQATDTDFGSFNVTETPLGSNANKEGSSIIISLNLGDLNHADFEGNNIFFQVVSVPLINGDFDLAKANVSELDHYEILRKKPGGKKGSGSKVSEKGSKLASDTSSSGSKASDDSTGSKTDSSGGGSSSDSGSNGGK